MSDRRNAGILALAGAVLLGIGCWLPYNTSGGTDFAVFQRHDGYSGELYFAIEAAAVMIAAAALGLILLRGALPVVWSGVLIAMGCQTALMWVGYLGSSFASSNGPGFATHVRAGGWIGLAGSLVIALGGIVALRAASTVSGTVTPAGWYADPRDAARLRYWSGSYWTEHTAD
ncbi:MAG: DUF2510 domain-containing protein [Gaiellales bacterium]